MATKYLELAQGKIAYDDAGSGPLVVCAPSLGDLRGEYRFLTPQLVAAGYRVITTDLRGLGESSPDWPDYSVGPVGSDLLALIRSLKAGPAILIGTSMAAGAAVWAAAEAPELVAGLVLIGPSVHGEMAGPSAWMYKLLLARPWGPSVWTMYYNGLYPTQKPEDLKDYISALHANLKQPGRWKAVQGMSFASKQASEERLPDVKTEAMVIMGTRDADFKQPEEEARWVADKLSGRYVMIQDSGHYPHAEMPEKTGSEIIRFLEALNLKQEEEYAAEVTPGS